MAKRRKTSTQESTTQEPAYSTGEVAKMFGVTNKTVLQWIKDDKIPAFKTPGGQNRINECEIEKFKKEKGDP